MNSKILSGENGALQAAISVAAAPSEFAIVRMRVTEFAIAAGLSGGSALQITLILEELFANLLNHGGGAAETGGADIVLRRDGVKVHIGFSDDGAAFNPLDAPPPGLEGGADHRPVGGLGLHLIRELTDHVAYRRADGRNVLDMEMTLAVPQD